MKLVTDKQIWEKYPDYKLQGDALQYYCPGCKFLHRVNTIPEEHRGFAWAFNGDFDKPTFTPSVNFPGKCHHVITDGIIYFCDDSAHELKGQTVPLPEIPMRLLPIHLWSSGSKQ